MKLDPGHVVLAALTLLAVITVILTILFFKYRRRFTRERFAFAALSMNGFLIFSTVGAILAQAAPWEAIMMVVSRILGLAYQPVQLNTVDVFFACLLVFCAMQWSWKMFQGWDGLKSVEQAEREKRQTNQGPEQLIKEGFDEIKVLLKTKPPRIISEPDSRLLPSALEAPTETQAWHIQACDLLCLKSASYFFDQNRDWHDQPGCWIGTNTKTEDMVVVKCDLTLPVQDELRRLIAYVRKIADMGPEKPRAIEYIVALKEGSLDRQIQIDGNDMRVVSETALLDDLVDFSDYFFSITKKVEREHLPDSDWTLRDVYVPSAFKLHGSENGGDNLENYLGQWLMEPGQRQ